MPCTDASAPVPSPTLDNPPSISAKELHGLLLTAHAGGNLARRRFIDALRALHESRLYLHLGFPDIAAYADATFRLQRSQVFECLRVSKALVHLPRLAAAFERGELSWSLVRALTRVVDEETEGEWLEFLEGRSVRAVHAEIKDAERKRRKRPRRDGYGLPALPVKLTFELAPQDHAVVERGLEKVASEMGRSLDGAKPSPPQALLFLMLRILQTDPETDPQGSLTAGRAEREHSPFTVVFHRCPDCRRAAVESAEGRVEVAAEAIDRVEVAAEHVVIDDKSPEAVSEIQVPAGERDRPNTSAMRRSLFHREGGRCANPYCRCETGAEGHGHHIRLRSAGGRTELWNEVWLCLRCHALVHAGCLKLEGDPIHGLEWTPVAADLTRSVREALERMSGLARACVVEVTGESTPVDCTLRTSVLRTSVLRTSAAEPRSEAEADVVAGLVGLGWSHADAVRRLDRARGRLGQRGEDPDTMAVESLLQEALRR
jgi:hypothetical protein